MILKNVLVMLVSGFGTAIAQPTIPFEFEIDVAEDMRDFLGDGITPAVHPLDSEILAIRSIAAEGDTLILSRAGKGSDAPGADNSLRPGEFLVYRKNSTGQYELKDVNNDSVENIFGVSLVGPQDTFGWNVAINGNTLVVGASHYPMYNDPEGTDPTDIADLLDSNGVPIPYPDGSLGQTQTGAVFIYKRFSQNSDVWTVQQILYSPDPINGERYGHHVAFHGDRILVASPREYTPGFAHFGGLLGQCLNVGGEIDVYEFDPSFGKYVLSQEIVMPFIDGETSSSGVPLFGAVPVIDSSYPLDDRFNCAGLPPICRLQPNCGNETAFQAERAREFAVDGDWLVVLAHLGVYIYKYNNDPNIMKYEFEKTFSRFDLPSIPTPKGWTSCDISDGVIVVTAKPKPGAGGNSVPGWTRVFEYENAEWEFKLTWQDDGSGVNGSSYSSFIDNGQILISRGQIMLRYVKDTDQLLFVGKADLPNAQRGPGANVVRHNDQYFLPDTSTFNASNTVPFKMRAISVCPYDLNGDGALNNFDLSEYMSMYFAGDPQADYKAPFGVFDINDVNHYLALYNSGCP